MNLDEIRVEIDKIDEELYSIIEKRNKLVDMVAEYKKNNGIAIYDPKREEEKLSRYDVNDDFKKILRLIMDLSKERQKSSISNKHNI